MTVLFFIIMAGVSFAAEDVMEKEKVPGVIITEEIIKTADNFIVLFDSSSSMKESFQNTGLTKFDAVLYCLSDLFLFHGILEHIRSDNGPEFTAKVVR